MKEKKARIEDALHATRAAIEEGIVPGGGVALVRCIESVETLKLKGDEKTGAQIVAKALKMPCYWIADNAGAVGNIVVNKVAQGKGGFGYNADTDKYEDLIAAGVLDPVKVTRIALQNSASVAGLLLTTDCVVTEQPSADQAGPGGMPPGMPGGMGGMGGMPGGMGGMGGMPGMGMM
jgi:chaperonin GroEL